MYTVHDAMYTTRRWWTTRGNQHLVSLKWSARTGYVEDIWETIEEPPRPRCLQARSHRQTNKKVKAKSTNKSLKKLKAMNKKIKTLKAMNKKVKKV